MIRFVLVVLAAMLVPLPLGAQSSLFGGNELIEFTKVSDVSGVRAALTRGARPNDADGDGMTALMYAAQNGDTDIIELLLENKASHKRRSKRGATALALAAQLNQVDAAELLLDKGADINAPDKQGFTPLIRAARQGHLGMIELLVDRKADLNWRDHSGVGALEWAERKRKGYIAQILKKAGAE